MTKWVYQRTEPNLYTVGFYAPDGGWHTDDDFDTRDEARARTAELNGVRFSYDPNCVKCRYSTPSRPILHAHPESEG